MLYEIMVDLSNPNHFINKERLLSWCTCDIRRLQCTIFGASNMACSLDERTMEAGCKHKGYFAVACYLGVVQSLDQQFSCRSAEIICTSDIEPVTLE